MAWWNRKSSPREVVQADWIGEKLAEMFDPTRTLQLVVDAHPSLSGGDEPFLSLASLRLVGFQLGAAQKTVTTRVDKPVIEQIQLSFVAALVKTYVESLSHPCDSPLLIGRLLSLG
jgi:hypothetical protein